MKLNPNNLPEKRIVLAGCLLLLLYAVFSQGVYHSDEHFQILEYAGMKLFGKPAPENLSWEYTLRMRSGVQPFVAWAFGRALTAAGLYSPFVLVFLLQLLSASISAAVLLLFYRTVRDELGGEAGRKGFLLLGFFLWFLAYLHVHFTSEMLAGNLLLLLAALTMRSCRRDAKGEFGRGLLLGLAAGAAFVVRYQTGFALAGYGIWLLAFHRRGKLYLGMIPGVLLALAAGFSADRWLYGQWTFTPLNYLHENLLSGYMSTFGTRPWWYYITASILAGGVVYGLLLLVVTLWYFMRRPRHVVSWMLVPFLLAHFFLGHKEVRFFFPVLFFAPYFIVLFVKELPDRVFRTRGWKWTVGVLAAFNLVAVAYCLTQVTPDIYFYKMMRRYCSGRGEIVALNIAGEKSYYSMPWPVGAAGGGVMEARFYMPDNLDSRHFDSPERLEEAARMLAAQGKEVLVLSPDPELDRSSSLPLRKIVWSPYPGWVLRHFNFNDWTRYSVRSKNVYEVVIPPAGE